MRNKYPARCYVCGQPVGPGDGQFEPHGSRGRVRHDGCGTTKIPDTDHRYVTSYIEKSEKH